jgi:hypothetical protein
MTMRQCWAARLPWAKPRSGRPSNFQRQRVQSCTFLKQGFALGKNGVRLNIGLLD